MTKVIDKSNPVAARSLRDLLLEFYGSNGFNGELAKLTAKGDLHAVARAKLAICKAAFAENHGMSNMAASDIDRAMSLIFKRGTYTSSASCPTCCKRNVIMLHNQEEELERFLGLEKQAVEQPSVNDAEAPTEPTAPQPKPVAARRGVIAPRGTFVFVLHVIDDKPSVFVGVVGDITSPVSQMVENLATGEPIEVSVADMYHTASEAYAEYKAIKMSMLVPTIIEPQENGTKKKVSVKAGNEISNGEKVYKVHSVVDKVIHAKHGDEKPIEISFDEFKSNWVKI